MPRQGNLPTTIVVTFRRIFGQGRLSHRQQAAEERPLVAWGITLPPAKPNHVLSGR